MRAVVVGAGIAGLATAIGLRQAGWQVRVLERWPQVSDLGTGLGIWPQAQTALTRLGLGSVLADAAPYRQGSIRRPDGRVLTRLPLRRVEQRHGRPVLLVSRTALIAALLEHLGDVDLRTGVTVTDPADLAARCDLLVAADGLRSAVRPALFTDPGTPTPVGHVAWRGTVPGVDPAVRCFGETWGRGRIFGITPSGDGRTNWYASVAGPVASGTLDDLRARYAGWHEPIPAILAAADPDTVLRHEIQDLRPPLRSYVRGSTVLVGDAAHAAAPSLGQGACQALIDADCLTTALREHTDVPTALADYDTARRGPTQRLVARSRTVSRVMGTSRWAGLRDVALRLTAPLSG